MKLEFLRPRDGLAASTYRTEPQLKQWPWRRSPTTSILSLPLSSSFFFVCPSRGNNYVTFPYHSAESQSIPLDRRNFTAFLDAKGRLFLGSTMVASLFLFRWNRLLLSVEYNPCYFRSLTCAWKSEGHVLSTQNYEREVNKLKSNSKNSLPHFLPCWASIFPKHQRFNLAESYKNNPSKELSAISQAFHNPKTVSDEIIVNLPAPATSHACANLCPNRAWISCLIQTNF